MNTMSTGLDHGTMYSRHVQQPLPRHPTAPWFASIFRLVVCTQQSNNLGERPASGELLLLMEKTDGWIDDSRLESRDQGKDGGLLGRCNSINTKQTTFMQQ